MLLENCLTAYALSHIITNLNITIFKGHITFHSVLLPSLNTHLLILYCMPEMKRAPGDNHSFPELPE